MVGDDRFYRFIKIEFTPMQLKQLVLDLASGKSRTLMFIALDKLRNQGLKNCS
jgi:hypothetical protein